MKGHIENIIIFIAICLLGYIVFSKLRTKGVMEGLENASDTDNGIAGGAASYGAIIKANAIKSQDTLLITKYRKDYETVILNLDDFVSNLMLETTLSIDTNNPMIGLKKLVDLNQSKVAFNAVRKIITKQ
jgi:hypothetical protein